VSMRAWIMLWRTGESRRLQTVMDDPSNFVNEKPVNGS
jgi:hypothetical protein